MLIISDEDRIGDALSGLPFIYHAVDDELLKERSVYLLFKNKQVLSLVPEDVRRKLSLIESIEDLWLIKPRLGDQRVVNLYVQSAFRRYGARDHMMLSHFHNYGFFPKGWTAPKLEFRVGGHVPQYDLVISPFSKSDFRNNKLWPLDRWQELINFLSADYAIVVVGAQDDPQALTGVSHFFGRPLSEVCALMSRARIGTLSIDNGVSHLAHALRVPHFLIYPSSQPPSWACNTNDNALRIIGAPMGITVSQVRRALEPMLRTAPRSSASDQGLEPSSTNSEG